MLCAVGILVDPDAVQRFELLHCFLPILLVYYPLFAVSVDVPKMAFSATSGVARQHRQQSRRGSARESPLKVVARRSLPRVACQHAARLPLFSRGHSCSHSFAPHGREPARDILPLANSEQTIGLGLLAATILTLFAALLRFGTHIAVWSSRGVSRAAQAASATPADVHEILSQVDDHQQRLDDIGKTRMLTGFCGKLSKSVRLFCKTLDQYKDLLESN
jgi:hypothetical protein